MISVEQGLTEINQPIKVSLPSDFTKVEELTHVFWGLSREEYLLKKQAQNINFLRADLSIYQRTFGYYPASLGKFIDWLSSFTGGPQGYDIAPSLEEVDPARDHAESKARDVFTGGYYSYERLGDDYTLRYKMSFPPRVELKKFSSLFYLDHTAKPSPKIIPYADGTNTATSKSASLEGVASLNTDKDRDGLPDKFEEYLGTDKANRDTDRDGVSDADELRRNRDPLEQVFEWED